MKEIKLEYTNNIKILESEENEEFEGLCGTENGILWEDSLEQFFEANKIEILLYKSNRYIVLQQDQKVIIFPMIIEKYACSTPQDHIDFRHGIIISD